MTSAAFSCDIARSTFGSTTSPAFTEGTPDARARIFSTAVMLITRFLSPVSTDDLRCAPIFVLHPLVRQILIFEFPVFLQSDEIGEFLKAGNPLRLPGQGAGGRCLERL